jgi:hypothetical protein
MTLADQGTLDPMVGQCYWPSAFLVARVKLKPMQAF